MPGLPLRTSAESGAGPSDGSEAVLGDPMPKPLISGSAVRKLWVGETELYRQHLLRLDAESRRNRFGGAVSDEFIRRYSGPSTLNGAVIYGFFVKGVLRGAAELRLLARAGEAEAALSVERAWQSQGVGTALLERVLLAVGNRQVKHLHMLCLAENRRMQQLARKIRRTAEFSIRQRHRRTESAVSDADLSHARARGRRH